jgi:hypothetical protein
LAAVATINVTVRPRLTKCYISEETWEELRRGCDNWDGDMPSDIVSACPKSGKLVIWLASSPLEVVDDEED